MVFFTLMKIHLQETLTKRDQKNPESIAPQFFMNPYDGISWHLHQQRDIVSM